MNVDLCKSNLWWFFLSVTISVDFVASRVFYPEKTWMVYSALQGCDLDWHTYMIANNEAKTRPATRPILCQIILSRAEGEPNDWLDSEEYQMPGTAHCSMAEQLLMLVVMVPPSTAPGVWFGIRKMVCKIPALIPCSAISNKKFSCVYLFLCYIVCMCTHIPYSTVCV